MDNATIIGSGGILPIFREGSQHYVLLGQDNRGKKDLYHGQWSLFNIKSKSSEKARSYEEFQKALITNFAAETLGVVVSEECLQASLPPKESTQLHVTVQRLVEGTNKSIPHNVLVVLFEISEEHLVHDESLENACACIPCRYQEKKTEAESTEGSQWIDKSQLTFIPVDVIQNALHPNNIVPVSEGLNIPGKNIVLRNGFTDVAAFCEDVFDQLPDMPANVMDASQL